MLLALYWAQNMIGAHWWWMSFISPVLDGILDFVNSIYSFSFNFWGQEVEIKYFNSLLLMLIFILGLKGINIVLEKLREIYEDAHILYKKTTENIYNYKMNMDVKNNEKQINDYSIFIQTQISRRYVNKQNNIDIDDLNKQMNKYIYEHTNVMPMENWGGYVYTFNDFENIDNILDILFRITGSEAPLDYLICIQVGSDYKKLKYLINLQEWGKIIFSADTLLRYEYNNIKGYKTTNVGVFQKEDNLLEVHEFIEKM